MPTNRNHMFSGMVNGEIYVIGGRIGHGGSQRDGDAGGRHPVITM